MESQFDVAAVSILSCYHAWQQSVRLASSLRFVQQCVVRPGSPVENDPAADFVYCDDTDHGTVAGREVSRSALLQCRCVQGGEIGLGFLDALGGGLLEPRARLRRVWRFVNCDGFDLGADRPGRGARTGTA